MEAKETIREQIFVKVREHLKHKYGEKNPDDSEPTGWLTHVASGDTSEEDEEFWAEMFQSMFVENFDDTNDDLLFFVHNDKDRYEDVVVHRHHSPKAPIPGDSTVNWEETFYLNIILHTFTYTLTMVVGQKLIHCPMKLISKVERQMYPSPSRTRMDTAKGTVTELTYPHIFFPIDDFNDFFKSVVVDEGEQVCVELVASVGSFQTAIFQGSVSHDALMRAYTNKKSSVSAWEGFAQLIKSTQRMEFLKMKGPKGVGQAEMAVCIAEEALGLDAFGKPCMTSAQSTSTQ
eukprot:Ihof_evm6s18 gene=Ihof_evmTU6s18